MSTRDGVQEHAERLAVGHSLVLCAQPPRSVVDRLEPDWPPSREAKRHSAALPSQPSPNTAPEPEHREPLPMSGYLVLPEPSVAPAAIGDTSSASDTSALAERLAEAQRNLERARAGPSWPDVLAAAMRVTALELRLAYQRHTTENAP